MAWFIIKRASECSRKQQEVNLLGAIMSGHQDLNDKEFMAPVEEIKGIILASSC